MGMTETIRRDIQDRMNKLGLTQYRLAKEHGVSQALVSRLLSGERYEVSPAVLELLDVLGLELVVRPKSE